MKAINITNYKRSNGNMYCPPTASWDVEFDDGEVVSVMATSEGLQVVGTWPWGKTEEEKEREKLALSLIQS